MALMAVYMSLHIMYVFQIDSKAVLKLLCHKSLIISYIYGVSKNCSTFDQMLNNNDEMNWLMEM